MHEHQDTMLISGPHAIADLPPVPWKNGGGLTRTVVQHPPDASLETFLWRISLAEIHTAGSFSVFPGIDRTILLWTGEGLLLHSQAWPDQLLSVAAPPFAFQGESQVSCELISGPSQDLNLMARRGTVFAVMHVATATRHLQPPCDDLIILCAQGSVRVLLNNKIECKIQAGHYLRISGINVGVTLDPLDQESRFAYITIGA